MIVHTTAVPDTKVLLDAHGEFIYRHSHTLSDVGMWVSVQLLAYQTVHLVE